MATRRTLLPLIGALLLLAPAARADEMSEAKKAIEKKDWPAAFEHLAIVLEKTPDHRDAALALARVSTEGNYADAYPLADDALQRVLEKAPQDREARVALGETYLAHALRLTASPQVGSSVAPVFADAKTHFAALVAADPGDEEGGVGLARVAYFQGDFPGAIAAVDALLAKKPTSGKASFWKGQALYLQALDAYKTEGPRAEKTRDLFGKAAGAYDAAAAADPKSYDTWMQVAYSRQYRGDVDLARAAYEKAMDLDTQSFNPLKGIEALYSGAEDPSAYGTVLAALVKAHPKNAAAPWYLGHRHLLQKEWDDALKQFESFQKLSTQAPIAFVWIAKAYEGKGDAKKALDTYEKALKVNPDDVFAADALEAPLRARAEEAKRSPRAALDLVEAHKSLFAMAPRNALIRNNLGFLLRDAVDANSQGKGEYREVSGDWLKVLKECVRVYEEGTLAIGEWRPEMATQPWATRYQNAGSINDTGLMYWYYPQVRDAEKAERYYLRALEFTDSGYRDACTNLIKMYGFQEKWDKAWGIAEECVEALKDPEGNPDGQGRSMVEGMMNQLRAQGHAPAN